MKRAADGGAEDKISKYALIKRVINYLAFIAR